MFSCKPTIPEMQCNISGRANWHCEKWEVDMPGTYLLYYLVLSEDTVRRFYYILLTVTYGLVCSMITYLFQMYLILMIY